MRGEGMINVMKRGRYDTVQQIRVKKRPSAKRVRTEINITRHGRNKKKVLERSQRTRGYRTRETDPDVARDDAPGPGLPPAASGA